MLIRYLCAYPTSSQHDLAVVNERQYGIHGLPALFSAFVSSKVSTSSLSFINIVGFAGSSSFTGHIGVLFGAFVDFTWCCSIGVIISFSSAWTLSPPRFGTPPVSKMLACQSFATCGGYDSGLAVLYR